MGERNILRQLRINAWLKQAPFGQEAGTTHGHTCEFQCLREASGSLVPRELGEPLPAGRLVGHHQPLAGHVMHGRAILLIVHVYRSSRTSPRQPGAFRPVLTKRTSEVDVTRMALWASSRACASKKPSCKQGPSRMLSDEWIMQGCGFCSCAPTLVAEEEA